MPDSRFLRTLFTLILASIVLVTLTGPVRADVNDPGGNFIDDDGAYYEGSVEAIVAAGTPDERAAMVACMRVPTNQSQV